MCYVFPQLNYFSCFKQLMVLQMLLVSEQGKIQIVLHVLCHINMDCLHLCSFTPSLK